MCKAETEQKLRADADCSLDCAPVRTRASERHIDLDTRFHKKQKVPAFVPWKDWGSQTLTLKPSATRGRRVESGSGVPRRVLEREEQA